jgi:hypothetical protein
MAILDDLKRLGDKAKGLVVKNDDKVKKAIDKAAALADKQTKGKYSEKLGGVAAKAKGAVDKLPDQPPAAEKPDQPPAAEKPDQPPAAGKPDPGAGSS